jgi:hypothetical protein
MHHARPPPPTCLQNFWDPLASGGGFYNWAGWMVWLLLLPVHCDGAAARTHALLRVVPGHALADGADGCLLTDAHGKLVFLFPGKEHMAAPPCMHDQATYVHHLV